MEAKTLNVGVIGLGMMGSTHLDVYSKLPGVRIAAVADAREDLLHGRASATGNIKGQAQGGVDLSQARKYTDGMDLIADAGLDVIDICLPTPMHLRFAQAALASGRHVLLEKPLARTAQEADALVAAAQTAGGLTMPAMCMRFWPGWDWLKSAIDDQRYGRVLAASFRRVASHPGGSFYSNGEACGGAILDLHIHDTDFVQWCFGTPQAVTSRGYRKITSHHDHVMTQYHYPGPDAPIVSAEGSWAMAPGFPFNMQYTVNFERATAVFDLAAQHPLVVHENGSTQPVTLPAGMGYEHEIRYFIDCIRKGQTPTTVSFEDAARSLHIIEAEVRSIDGNARVDIASTYNH